MMDFFFKGFEFAAGVTVFVLLVFLILGVADTLTTGDLYDDPSDD